MTLKGVVLLAVVASGVLAAVKVWAKDSAAARSSGDDEPKPLPPHRPSSSSSSGASSSSSSSSKRWPVPAGFRPVRASEITPELRQAANDITTTLQSAAPGSFFPFTLEGKLYGALRTAKGVGFRYFVQMTPEEASEQLEPNVPLPDSLTH